MLELIPNDAIVCINQINSNMFKYCLSNKYWVLPKRPIYLIDIDGKEYLDYVIDCYDNVFLTYSNHNNIIKIKQLISDIRINNIDINKIKISFDYIREQLPSNNLWRNSLDYITTNIKRIIKKGSKYHYEINLDLELHFEYQLKIINEQSINYNRMILQKDLYFERCLNQNEYIIDKLFEKDLIVSSVITDYFIQNNKGLGNTELVFKNNFTYLDKNYCLIK